jgi:hypothetical protein
VHLQPFVAVLGFCDDDELDSDTIEQKVFEKFEVGMAQFQKIAEALIAEVVDVVAGAVAGDNKRFPVWYSPSTESPQGSRRETG